MAKKFWDEPIDKNVPWDGNESTDNLPVRGTRVEEFIKNTFEDKFGTLHYDVANNRYLAFADQASLELYLEDPTRTDLVLGAFDAPFNYTAEISLGSPTYNAVFLGSKGNYIDFTFDIKNKQGASTGENVTVTYTFIRNAHKKVITETRRFGEAIHFNVDDYIESGTNTVIIGVMGQTTLAATTVAVTYQVVDLSLTDEINVSNVYNLTNGAQTMEVFFTVSGYGVKTVEWFLDGEQLPFVKSEDEVVDVSSSRTKYIALSNLSSGAHTLQIRAYTVLNGEKFYTDTLYREVIVYNGDTSENVVALAVSVPNSHGIVTESNPLVFYGAEQYLPYEVRFATRKSAEVNIYLGDTLLTTVGAVAGKEMSHSIVSNKEGTFALKFVADGVEREIPFVVSTTSLDIEEITTALAFDFSARGRNNSAVDKDSWAYNEYTATFEGFNWNASSGWVNNALLINNGARFSVNIAPLMADATGVGKTLEFEFSTRNVEDDNAVICDMTTNGVGLLITASGVKLTSAAGETVDTKFKAGEVNRIAFVINRKNGVTYKGLAFVYVNGILSGAVSYGSGDNFMSSSQLSFVGTADAQIELRSMRFYNTALTADNILNNYILYRDTLTEMLEVYYRNDVYDEGTQDFSPYAVMRRLPVMIITGDIPTLEAATSTSTQVLVDIEYTNEQDPTKNFKMLNAALRIQGTSSLAYPRKNFRFYTKKEESTVVYDSEGRVISDKLYSFKDGAQPVDCWCLKADFAESSGTHNTGIARVWNDVLRGAIVQHKNILGEEVNGYVLRTDAQRSAIESGYAYDVRTTIDGFPIALFYKRNASDTNLIFLGKYNFNNDKSTPSVFGFEGIPGFDNTRMQCWETKDNGHPLGLFTDVSSFDTDWSEAFESRYPDTKTPNTTDLKNFSLWINGVSQENFATEKWAHLDVYKMAAYYCYLMRFGAVDQTVKNGFITSEDGEHFYFINYDNDTINGLINTGELRLDPTINRQTIGSDGEYVYAGHDSVLWNRCEADSEFMEIVSIVDNALYVAGLRYDEVIRVFNEEQAAKWVERVYNQDAEYKYLLPFVNSSTDNLFMLQGSRSSHRSWWLSKRFALYDSLFVSGNYKDRNISFKCLNNTQPGQQFTVTSGTAMNYGYGVNNGTRDVGVYLDKDESHTFTTTDTLNLGDVVKVFAAANLSALDVSAMGSRIAVFDCTASVDPALGSKLKRLILGGASVDNTELSSISGIGVLTALQELNVEGYRNITYLNLAAQTDLRKVNTLRSRVASIDFAPGAPVERLELAPLVALNLRQLPYITSENVVMNFSATKSVVVSGCPNVTNDFDFVTDWMFNKTVADSECSLEMDNVNWVNVPIEKFLSFSQHKTNGLRMSLMGKVSLIGVTLEQVTMIQNIWGEDCFDKNADFHISFPDMVYINPTEATINEGESLQFSHTLFAFNEGTVAYGIVSGSRAGVTIDPSTGLLTSVENGVDTSTIVVGVTFTPENGESISDTAQVTIKKRVYPTADTINLTGATTVQKDETYSWSSSMEGVNGDIEATWELSGAAVNNGYISLGETSTDSCEVKFHKAAEPGNNITAVLSLNLRKRIDSSIVATKTLSIKMATYSYPTSDNTTFEGETTPSTDNPVYRWASTAEGLIGPISVAYSLDDAIAPYFEIESTEWDANNPLQGSCTLRKIKGVTTFAEGNVNVTITRVNSGESFTLSKTMALLNPDVIMTSATNPVVLQALYDAGLCESNEYMLKSEAEAVKDGSFNPTGTSGGSIFYGKNITSFDEFRYFTGMTTLDAYAFENCDNLSSLKMPKTVRRFNKMCCYRKGNRNGVSLHIDEVSVDYIDVSAFGRGSYNMTSNEYSHVIIDHLNWFATETAEGALANTEIGTAIFYALAEQSSLSLAAMYYATLGKVVITEGITLIPVEAFYNAIINSLEIPDTVTSISKRGIAQQSVTGTKVYIDRFSKNITSLGTSAITGCVFNCDVEFGALTSLGTGVFDKCSFMKTLDLSALTSNISVESWFINGGNRVHTLIYPETSRNSMSGVSSSTVIEHLCFPNIANYTASSSSGMIFIAGVAQNIYAKNSEGTYEKIEELDYNKWGMRQHYNFDGCSCIKSVKTPGYGDWEDSKITSLTIVSGGTSSVSNFKNCKDLISIKDETPAGEKTCGIGAFDGINENVIIESETFGIYTYAYCSLIETQPSNKHLTLRFCAPQTISLVAGAYFDDMTTTRSYTAPRSSTIMDITNDLKIGYLTIKVTSNKSDAQFRVDYTDINSGEAASATVGVGETPLPMKPGTSATVTAVTEYEGLMPSGAKTIASVGGVNSAAIDFIEKTDIYIQHIDGMLYTTDEWTAGGYTNDQANGVAVVCASASFVVAKSHNGEVWWADKSTKVDGVLLTNTQSVAITDFAGVENTALILGALTSGAAHACSDYTFPNGAKGYLPALGELNIALRNKVKVQEALTLIGGSTLTHTLWSSTQYNTSNIWVANFATATIGSSYKRNNYRAHPFTTLN